MVQCDCFRTFNLANYSYKYIYVITIHLYTVYRVSEESYQAHRNTLYRNASTIPLNETGPVVNIRVSVRNSRAASNGTAFPQTRLLMYLPVEFREQPLLIPTSLVVSSGNIYCSHYQAIPNGLVRVFTTLYCNNYYYYI